MSLGLIEADEVTMVWHWLPIAPWPLARPLPQRLVRDDRLFRLAPLTQAVGERSAYQAAFGRLAAVTPDLRLYRLIRLFNAPLLSISTKDAGQAQWAPWSGKVANVAKNADGEPRAHLWFFDARGEAASDRIDIVILEYAFDGGLVLRAEKKPLPYLQKRYELICDAVHTPRPLSPSRVHTLVT